MFKILSQDVADDGRVGFGNGLLRVLLIAFLSLVNQPLCQKFEQLWSFVSGTHGIDEGNALFPLIQVVLGDEFLGIFVCDALEDISDEVVGSFSEESFEG